MKIFITGATGMLGRRLVRQLSDGGHTIVALVRNDTGEQLVADRGGTPCRGDVLDPASLEWALDDDVEVLIHAATAIPAATKPSEDDWALNNCVRLTGILNLLEQAPVGLEHVLFPSVVWVARQPDGALFDESVDRHPDRATRSVAAVEDILIDLGATSDIDTTVLRCGFFMRRTCGTRACGRYASSTVRSPSLVVASSGDGMPNSRLFMPTTRPQRSSRRSIPA